MARNLRMTVASRRHERGFILIVVLVFAALLASLLAGALEMSSSYVFSAAAYSDASRADELGRTAAALVAQQTLSPNPNAKRGGSFAVHLDDADVIVDYLSEAARIDVNTTQPELLVALFKAAGVEPADAEAIGGRIKAWLSQSASGGASAQATQQGSQTRIEHEAQIADAWGISEEVFAKVRSSLTVSNPSGKIDPVLANKLIVEAIFGGDQLSAEDFLQQRAHGFATEHDALLTIPLGARGYVGFSPAKAFRAMVRVHLLNRVERSYEMVVIPPQKLGDTVQVTSWEAL
jgi:general secretion pathway protein K